MKIQRVNDQVRVLFDELVPDAPGVEVKPMFGQRAAWVNGNMFMGTFEDRLVVRLPDDGRAELAAAGGERFEPMGRPMREYMMLPAGMHADPRGLAHWVGRALDHVAAMPPKVKKPRSKRPG